MNARALGLTAGLVFLSGCEFCEPPDLDPTFPAIALVDPDDASISPCEVDRVRDCRHDFGAVPTNQGRFFTVRVLNDGDGPPLAISQLTLDGDPAFTLVDPPAPNAEGVIVVEEVKRATEPVDLVIRFAPVVASEVTATLTIVSDGENVVDDPTVVLELVGTGADVSGPEISVTPAECSFGEVGVLATAYCDLSIANVGNRDLRVDPRTFSPSTPLAASVGDVGFGVTDLNFETFVAPGTAFSIRVHATPGAPEAMSGELLIGSNDPGQSVVSVPLSLTGAEAPTAVAEIKSVNGVNVGASVPTIYVLDDVILTGENSVASTPGATIDSYTWELLPSTNGSSATLTTPNNVTTGFTFGSGQLGIDAVGTYEVRLTVSDSAGLTSSNDARVTFDAQVSQAILFQLTWDSPSYDLDLHVVKDSGSYCSQQSCYYGNCKPGAVPHPEWDGDSGRTPGDPSLDIDDLSGYGPENINIDQPEPGTYKVSVHNYSSLVTEEVFATVKVYVNGALAHEASRQILFGNDLWEVAEVSWTGTVGILFPIDDYTASAGTCPFGLSP